MATRSSLICMIQQIRALKTHSAYIFLMDVCVVYHFPPSFLLQLFDTDNVVNRHASEYIFTTEGHLVKVAAALRDKPWSRDIPVCFDDTSRAITRANESFITHSVSLPV